LSPSPTRSHRHAFEQLDEPLDTPRFEITETHYPVSWLGPIGQVIETEIDERLSDATAQRFGAPLLPLDMRSTRLGLFGVEARQELIDRT
jgi:hypothetical protein